MGKAREKGFTSNKMGLLIQVNGSTIYSMGMVTRNGQVESNMKEASWMGLKKDME